MAKENDKYYLIYVFCLVVERGSFSKAADKLNVTTSAVSKNVSELEKRLSQVLLVRSTRSLALTEAGELVYRQGKGILQAFDDLETALDQTSTSVKGKLSITFPNTIGRRVFSQLCNEFQQVYPDIKLTLVFTSSKLDLIEDNIDIAFRTWHVQPDGHFYVLPLLQIRSIFVASPKYLESHGTPQTLEALQAHNILLTQLDNLEKEFQDAQKHVHLEGNLVANSRFHIREATLAGNGVALLPSYFCRQDLEEGALIELLPKLERTQRTLGALYKLPRSYSKKVDTFLRFIEFRLVDKELV